MRFRQIVQFILLITLVFAFAVGAQAQATRTWVSGVGDDVNPCSRTAPCKTFAGAISKTAAGGEINAIDPGGFGAVTITKSMTIDGAAQHSSVLASGTSGVIVNALATDTVTLRNLSINGAPPTLSGLRGVSILLAKTVNIENCAIFGFRGNPGRGVSIALNTGQTVNVYIRNTSIHDNLAAGIVISPTTGQPVVKLMIADSSLTGNASGIFASEGAQVSIFNTTIAHNTTAGVDAAGSIVPAVVNVDNSTIVNNATGVQTTGGATIRLGRTSILQNATRAFSVGGGPIQSYLDNYLSGNGAANVGALTNISANKQ
jgi:Right handed beta helix region